MPSAVQRSKAQHDDDNVVAEFEGPHLLPASPGWEKVADYALDHAALPTAP